MSQPNAAITAAASGAPTSDVSAGTAGGSLKGVGDETNTLARLKELVKEKPGIDHLTHAWAEFADVPGGSELVECMCLLWDIEAKWKDRKLGDASLTVRGRPAIVTRWVRQGRAFKRGKKPHPCPRIVLGNDTGDGDLDVIFVPISQANACQCIWDFQATAWKNHKISALPSEPRGIHQVA